MPDYTGSHCRIPGGIANWSRVSRYHVTVPCVRTLELPLWLVDASYCSSAMLLQISWRHAIPVEPESAYILDGPCPSSPKVLSALLLIGTIPHVLL